MRVKVQSGNATCNLCGGLEHTLYDEFQEWNILKCNGCGYCFTDPRPSPQSVLSYYTLGYFRDEEKKRFDSLDENGAFKRSGALAYEQRIVDIESRVGRRGSLLEVGAATGTFLKVMQSRGWKVHGVEVSAEAVELARRNEHVHLFCGALEEFRTEEKYDLVCMYHSLEHTPDPAYIIERSYELLNPGGMIVIEVPNLNGFDAKINKERRLMSYDLPRHLSHFTPKVLANKLTQTGFEILDVDLYYPNVVLKLVELRGLNRSAASSGTGSNGQERITVTGNGNLPLATRSSNWKARLLKSISKLLPGWRFTIVARK